MRNIADKSCRENQNTHFIFTNFVFEYRAVYEIIWKNIVEPDTYGYIHTLRICNTYCFSAAAMVARTHLNITRTLPVLFNFPLSVIIGPVPCIYSLVIWLMGSGPIRDRSSSET